MNLYLRKNIVQSLIIAQIMCLSPIVHAEEKVTLNFVNADIESVVRAVGQFTNKQVVIDPRIKAQINLITNKPVSQAEAFEQLRTVLRLSNYTIVEVNGIYRVVLEADATKQPTPVQLDNNKSRRGDQMVTQIFYIHSDSALNMLNVVRPLVSGANVQTLVANPANNSIIVTDYAENIRRIARVIAAMDMPNGADVDIIKLKHSLAVDLAAMVNRLLSEDGRTQDASQKTVVMADQRLNAIVIRSNSPVKAKAAKHLIEKLDQPTARSGNLWVVQLRNAEATKLAVTLRAILSGNSSGGDTTGSATSGSTMSGSSGNTANTNSNMQSGGLSASGSGGSGSGGLSTAASTPLSGSAQVTAGSGIVADPTTNSLIISGPEPFYRNLRNIIDRLDSRRAQIYVETLIVEVNANKAAELGIQWQQMSDGSGSNKFYGGTNFGSGGTNILGVASNLASVAGGLNIGWIKGAFKLPGSDVSITNLGMLAHALESSLKANVLSTPNIITLDNEEARVVVAQTIPFQTGSYAQTGSSISAPFQTFERKDVGLTLRVKPQVSEGGTVRMTIYQESSDVVDSTIGQAAGPTTNKRAFESNILAEDGQIVVLGGLIQDKVSGGVEKVPLLGNIPWLGQLFRYDSRKRERVNLMVFLRPYVIRDAKTADDITVSRYDYMRTEQINSIPKEHWALPQLGVPLLPEYTPAERPIEKKNGKSAPVNDINQIEEDVVVDPPPQVAQPVKQSSASSPTVILKKNDAKMREKKNITTKNGNVVLQIASYNTDERAQNLVKQLAEAGYEAFVFEQTTNQRVWYRVRVKTLDEVSATQIQSKLSQDLGWPIIRIRGE